MSNKSTIAALALLVLLASCACLGAFASWTLNNATSRAWRLQRGQRRMDLRSSHERGERFIALRYVKLRS